jgi:YD repeat-containing protein
MKTLTLEFLKPLKPCKEGLSWAINNQLIGMPFEVANEIEGDYNRYIWWVKAQLEGEFKYDDRNNLISKNAKGYRQWIQYDERNNEIYRRTSSGYQEWKTYDELNNLIYTRDSIGYQQWNEYDDRNNLIRVRNSGGGFQIWYDYDERNNLVHLKTSYGHHEWWEYDEKNNQIYYKNSDNYQKWKKYDERNNLIHWKDSTGNGIKSKPTIEYYEDGQLKQYDSLLIPYFEKRT